MSDRSSPHHTTLSHHATLKPCVCLVCHHRANPHRHHAPRTARATPHHCNGGTAATTTLFVPCADACESPSPPILVNPLLAHCEAAIALMCWCCRLFVCISPPSVRPRHDINHTPSPSRKPYDGRRGAATVSGLRRCLFVPRSSPLTMRTLCKPNAQALCDEL
jgi:hypothetical protein